MTEKKQTTTDIKRALRIYLDEIAIRHMTVHFLGLPHLKEEGVLSLEQIYIPITFTDKYKGRDPDVPRTSLIQLLKDHKRVVILGDPGTGKSTLVKHIAYSFARERKTPLQHHFGDLIPVPIILRDYSFQNIDTADGIIEAFWQNIWRGKNPTMELEDFKKALENGKAIFLLDGLDEKGDKASRKHLRELTYKLMHRFGESRFILTSRIIGYDEVRFNLDLVTEQEAILTELFSPSEDELREMLDRQKTVRRYVIAKGKFVDSYSLQLSNGERILVAKTFNQFYIAPFSDKEIDAFVDRWYEAKEQDEEERARKNKNLKTAIHENQSILDLARVPNLLTLMALVNFIYAHLPSGRAKLYEKITEAYLESIDKYRGILTYPVALETKKKWLAHIGFWMQERRIQQEQHNDKADRRKYEKAQSEILVSHDELIEQFRSIMSPDLGEAAAAESAPRFLRYISERSGLLIPRGPDDYAFVHLSFQEYFAAVSLYRRAFRFDELKTHAIANLQYRSWHETYILLFELLGISQSGACAELLDAIIRAAEDDMQTEEQLLAHGAAAFLSELLLDQETGLNYNDRQRAVNFCVLLLSGSDLNDSIINNLKDESIPDNPNLRQNAVAEIMKSPPQQLPPLFMIAAPLLFDNESAWIGQVEEYLQRHPANEWDSEMLTDALLFARRSNALLSAGLDSLAIDMWFVSYTSYYPFGSSSLSRLLLNRLFTASGPRASTIQWAGIIHHLTQSIVYRYCGFSLSSNVKARARDLAWARDRARDLAWARALARALALDRALDRDRDRALALALARDRALALALALALARDLAWARDRARDLALALARDNTLFFDEQAEGVLKGWRLNSAEAINSAYSYKPLDIEMTATLKRMSKNHKNQPERLLGLVALISLGLGNREMAERANTEIKTLFEHGPDPAQWPQEFGSGDPVLFTAISKELQRALPDIFLFESDSVPSPALLNPQLFDPNTPGSRFFTSTPDVFWPDFIQTLNDFANSGKEDKDKSE